MLLPRHDHHDDQHQHYDHHDDFYDAAAGPDQHHDHGQHRVHIDHRDDDRDDQHDAAAGPDNDADHDGHHHVHDDDYYDYNPGSDADHDLNYDDDADHEHHDHHVNYNDDDAQASADAYRADNREHDRGPVTHTRSTMDRYAIMHGDCLEVMRGMDAASVDAIVTDPPYGLSFMGKDWDHGVPGVHFWEAAMRVAKPGTHLLAFGGTRTFHRLTCAIEDAGWEIRDTIMWVYGSGFPKSLDVSKAIDKAAGAEREVIGPGRWNHVKGNADQSDCIIRPGNKHDVTAPATDAARQWQGWGTALKPAYEPIIVARKPLAGTVAENVTAHGTGALNVDGCRIGFASEADRQESTAKNQHADFGTAPGGNQVYGDYSMVPRTNYNPPSRWPANLIHDGSDEVVGLAGSAARFFYCAKASKADRDEGCEGMPIKQTTGGGGMNDPNGDNVCGKYGSVKSPARNHHPTVKPTALMRYLCRLVTPPGGIVLDPFAGSGSTGKAAMLEGFNFIGIELNAEYVGIARARIANAAVAV